MLLGWTLGRTDRNNEFKYFFIATDSVRGDMGQRSSRQWLVLLFASISMWLGAGTETSLSPKKESRKNRNK